MKTWSLITLIPGFAMLLACGGGGDRDSSSGSGNSGGGSSTDSADSTSGGSSQASGRTLFGIGLTSLHGVDTGSHEMVFDASPVREGQADVWSIDASDEQIWLGRSDGAVVVVDRATQEVVQTLDLELYSTRGEPVDASHLVLGEKYAYTTANDGVEAPIVRIDLDTYAATPFDVLSAPGDLTGMSYDGDHLWLVYNDQFVLVKADPETLEPLVTLELGQNPNDPDGEFGRFVGYGHLANGVDSVWVVDTRSQRLLRIDKESMVASVADDLSDIGDFSTYLEFHSNADSLFLLLSELDLIVRFDAQTGQRLMNYRFDDDEAGSFTVTTDRLYIKPEGALNSDALEVDIDSGETLQLIEAPVTMSAPLLVR